MKGAEQVRVFLTGRQVDAAGEESRIALSVKGRRFLRGESRYVSYDDTELIEGEMIPTMLRVGTSEVMLRRSGVVHRDLPRDRSTPAATVRRMVPSRSQR